MTYQELREMIGNRGRRKLANNTYARLEDDGAVIVRHQSTDIATLRPDGRVTLESGGWRTYTTKDRMNRFTPFCVYQDRGLWYVTRNGAGGEPIPYEDGIMLPDAFEDPAARAELAKSQGEERALRRKIRKYAQGFAEWIAAGNLPPLDELPGGDCWLCCMIDRKTGEPWGGDDREHYIGHMDEAYYVPTLLVSALREQAGGAPLRVHLIWDRLQRDPSDRWAIDDVRRAVRRFLYKRLGLVR